jgi:hypothetical protein
VKGVRTANRCPQHQCRAAAMPTGKNYHTVLSSTP